MRLDDLEKQATVLNQPEHQPGTVCVLSGETARYTQFAMCIQGLGYQIPLGSAVRWMLGSDISESRNQACEEMHGEWIWFIDDDHSFRSDIVKGLLQRKVDIVTPLCLRRNSPFLAVPTVDDDYMDLSLYEPGELVEVQHAGSSGMLIRRSVIESLEPPWFELGRDEQGRRVSEDVNFCRRAVEAGFKVHVDTGLVLGHITTAVVWPKWDENLGRWMTGFTIADGAEVRIESIPPAEAAARAAAEE